MRDKGFGVPHVYGSARSGRCSVSATWARRTGCSSWTCSATPVGASCRASRAGRTPGRHRILHSGENPERAKGVDHDFPVAAKFEWQGRNPDTWQLKVTPFARHPQAVDQSFLVNWNNEQARGYRSADANAYSSTYRSVLLSDRVRAGIAGARKLTLPRLIDTMEVAGTGDLRRGWTCRRCCE